MEKSEAAACIYNPEILGKETWRQTDPRDLLTSQCSSVSSRLNAFVSKNRDRGKYCTWISTRAHTRVHTERGGRGKKGEGRGERQEQRTPELGTQTDAGTSTYMCTHACTHTKESGNKLGHAGTRL